VIELDAERVAAGARHVERTSDLIVLLGRDDALRAERRGARLVGVPLREVRFRLAQAAPRSRPGGPRARTWPAATRSPRSASIVTTCPSTSAASSACAFAASVPTTDTLRSTDRRRRSRP
jgi:hypothetical protein